MKGITFTILAIAIICLLLPAAVFSQEEGDYRSAAAGDWEDAATWEVFQAGDWTAAAAPPDGSEHITVTDSVVVNTAVNISGDIVVGDEGWVAVDTENAGAMVFEDESSYEHARNGGGLPVATWEAGSTLHITGVTQNAPANGNQDFHDIVWNAPDQLSNLNLGWNGNTIGGDIHVISTGAARWQLTAPTTGDTATTTILGNIIQEGGQFSSNGTGNANTVIVVDTHGDVTVTGGNFSVSRGSQAGTGTTTWNLYGNLSLTDATTQNSNSAGARFVFAGAAPDSQHIAFTNVTFAGGRFNFSVSDSSILVIDEDMAVNGDIVNEGVIVPEGELTLASGGIYDHAQDGGTIPSINWAEGSTAMITGTLTNAPANRGQDYYNLVLNTPGLTANRDLSLDGNTIGGDIHVISTGTNRWQLVGGSSGTVTIMGDVIVEDGEFATQGTGSATEVVVDHYGDIIVTGGNFSISRGSQGSGVGSTRWILHEGDFTLTNATTQNSNPTNARFVFAADGEQTITLDTVTYAGGGTAIEVLTGTTLNFGTSVFGGNGLFILNESATLKTAHPDGVAGTLQTTGDITLTSGASFWFNGAEAQVTSTLMPSTVDNLTIDNAAGVTLSQSTRVNGTLTLAAGELDNTHPVLIGVDGELVVEGGTALNDVLFVEIVDQWDFEDQDLGDWYGISDDTQYSSTATIVDTMAFEGTYSVQLTLGDDQANGALVNDDYDLEPGYVVSYNVWVPVDTLDEINGLQTFIQINGWQWMDVWYGIDDLNQGEWNLLTFVVSDTLEIASTERIGVQVTGTGAAGTPTVFVDLITVEIAEPAPEPPPPIVIDVPEPPHAVGDTININGSFEIGTELGVTTEVPGWSFNITAGGANAEFEIVDDAQDGDRALRVDFGEWNQASDDWNVEATNEPFLVLEGDRIRATVWMKADQDGRIADLYLGLPESGGFQRKPDWGNEMRAVLTTEWQEFAFPDYTADALDEEHSMRFGITMNFEENDGGVLYIDNALVTVIDDVTSVEPTIPLVYTLDQNFPNPFNPTTQIRFGLPERADVVLEIYDVLGRRVATLFNRESLEAGFHTIQWDARNQAGHSISSGVYIYRLQAGDFVQTKRMMFLK